MTETRPGRPKDPDDEAQADSIAINEKGPLEQGFDAARANLRSGLILQLVALVIVLSYFFWPPAEAMLQTVADWKLRFGYFFSMPSTAFFGGLLPLFFLALQKGDREERPWSHLPFYLLFWAVKGFEVDTLYRLQARIFGDDHETGTLICKVLVDQFVYVPLWAAPTMVLGYLWKDSGYSVSACIKNLGRQWYAKRVLPLMIANWIVWVPAVAIIYCVELPLQLPLQNLILCMWCLVVIFMTRRVNG